MLCFYKSPDTVSSFLSLCSRGSVVVDFTLFVKDNAVGEVVSTLNKTVARGQMGSLAVDGLALRMQTTTAPTATTAATQPTTGTAQTILHRFSKRRCLCAYKYHTLLIALFYTGWMIYSPLLSSFHHWRLIWTRQEFLRPWICVEAISASLNTLCHVLPQLRWSKVVRVPSSLDLAYWSLCSLCSSLVWSATSVAREWEVC